MKPTFVQKLRLSPADFGLGSGLFYSSYVVMQVVVTFYLGKLQSPQLMLGTMNIVWGSISMLFAFISNSVQFYLLRVLLGIAESVAFPGSWYYATLFVPNRHLTVSLGFVELSIIVAMAISAPVAFLLFQLDGLFGLHDWQWLFVAEAVPSVLIGLYMILSLPSNPAQLRGMTDGEINLLQDNLHQTTNAQGQGTTQLGTWGTAGLVFSNWKLHYIILVYFLRNFAHDGMYYFTPVVILQVVEQWLPLADKSVQDNVTLCVTLAIWLVSCCSLLTTSRVSQALGAPRAVMGTLLIISGTFFCTLMRMDQLQPIMQLALIASSMIPMYSLLGISTSLMMTYVEGPAAAPSAGFYNAVGNVSSLLSPLFMGQVKQRTGSYQGAFWPFGLLAIASGVLMYFAPKTKYDKWRPERT